MTRWSSTILVLLTLSATACADPPVASYLFPAGGRQGSTVALRVGGVNLHQSCNFAMLGVGVEADAKLVRTKTLWFEGPLLPLPESQQQEDYPKDMAGKVKIAADAPLGVRHARVWSSQGGCAALKFMVGDLPEIVEEEIDGDPVPVAVTLPVTINGRIFPREDVDLWSFQAKKGQSIVCEVHAARLGSPLDSLLAILDPHGKKIAENDDGAGADSLLRFVAPEDGTYQVRIQDVNLRGGQAYVYRLTITAGPYVERLYPLGGKRGATVKFELTGQSVPAGPVDIAVPASAPRDFAHRLTVNGKQTQPFLLDVDDLPEHREKEPNDLPDQVQPIAVPAVCNGRIDKPGDVDCWAFSAKKGEAYEIDLRAGRLGSPLNGVLVLGVAGKELSRAEAGASDPVLRFSAAADGIYRVQVSERFRARGGPEFAYRLRIDRQPAADFRLKLPADSLTVNRGGEARLKIQAERIGGFKEPIELTIEGVPEGVEVTYDASGPAAGVIAGNQAARDIVLKTKANTPIRGGNVIVCGSAKIGDTRVTRTASLAAPRGQPELEHLLLTVALPTPFKIVGEHDFRWAPRGTFHRRSYKIERTGYDGPIEVHLADRQARHLQGATGPIVVVPAGATEFSYAIFIPPWMEMGRTCRVVVSASAVIKDPDGSEHTVCFSSIQPNEQVIVVVGPERLSVETERASIVARPGQEVALPVKITRGKGVTGPVKVELVAAAHMRGWQAESVMIPADQDRARLVVRFAREGLGPWNMPLVVRAMVKDKDGDIVGEMKLEVHEAD